jgi:hypothetical protein
MISSTVTRWDVGTNVRGSFKGGGLSGKILQADKSLFSVCLDLSSKIGQPVRMVGSQFLFKSSEGRSVTSLGK